MLYCFCGEVTEQASWPCIRMHCSCARASLCLPSPCFTYASSFLYFCVTFITFALLFYIDVLVKVSCTKICFFLVHLQRCLWPLELNVCWEYHTACSVYCTMWCTGYTIYQVFKTLCSVLCNNKPYMRSCHMTSSNDVAHENLMFLLCTIQVQTILHHTRVTLLL